MKIAFTFIVWLFFINLNAQPSLSDSAINYKMYKAQQYYTGVGESKSLQTAFELYAECARQGYPQAMTMLGTMYIKGQGVKANTKKAKGWYAKAGKMGDAHGWYLLGSLYKNAPQQQQNYQKAFAYFSKGADMGNDLCRYTKAYLLYKGFGCTQNYYEAASLFADGAHKGMLNSMYFYGVCLRNGYGVTQNNDSALYWLSKAANRGHTIAIQEFKTSFPENHLSFSYEENQTSSFGKNLITSGFITKEKEITNPSLEGDYKGLIYRYDWSGEFIIDTSSIYLSIYNNKGNFSGVWKEGDSLSMPFYATAVSTDQIIFNNFQQGRIDHNSFGKNILYLLEKADLLLSNKNDSVFLTGRIESFSPGRNEPQKPLYLSLVKNASANNHHIIKDSLSNPVNLLLTEGLTAYPNPFTDHIRINFTLTEAGTTSVQLKSLDGKVLYSHNTGIKEKGSHTISITTGNWIPGIYIITLQSSQSSKTIKMVKQ